MDDLDFATERMQRDEALALLRRKPAGPPPVGVCLYCDEPTEKRWCDADCRTFFEDEERLRKLRSP